MEWFLKVVKDNYANFNGRARRKEYWMFTLFSFIFSSILMILDNFLGLKIGGGEEIAGYSTGSGVLGSIFSLAILIPSIAVGVRRLHDVGKSGWNYLWAFTCIGLLYLLYLFIKEGDQGQNEYGADPKGGENEDPFAGQREANNPFSGQNNPFDNNDNNPFRNNQ